MKLSIQYVEAPYGHKLCFTHAVKMAAAVDAEIATVVVESHDKVECLICSGEITMDDILDE